MHHSGEEAHSAGESVATKPPEHLLGAMRKENYAEHPSENSCCYVVVRGRQFTNHIVLSRQVRLPALSQGEMIYPYIRILFVEVNANYR
jgi:hypothetical protein